MKTIIPPSILLALPLVACASLTGGSTPPPEEAQAEVGAVLEDFLLAKAEGDEQRYFGHMAPDAILFGTDAQERFTVGELREFMKLYFEQGERWGTHIADQNVFVCESGRMAWFDQLLVSERFGEMRCSGVLRKQTDGWKIVQNNVAFVVPNELALDLIQRISELPE